MPIVKADVSPISRGSVKARRVGRGSPCGGPSAASTPTRGHDSHGVIADPTYIDRIRPAIVPGAKWTSCRNRPDPTVIDGHWGFGFTSTWKAMELRSKARLPCRGLHGVPAGHVGGWPLSLDGDARGHDRYRHRRFLAVRRNTSPPSAARGAARHNRSRSRCLRPRGALYLDMASRGRAGKMRSRSRAAKRFQRWIIDKEGRHTPIPRNIQGRRPAAVGGSEGYKGKRLGGDGGCCADCEGWASARADRPHNDGVYGSVQCRGLPSAQGFQEGSRRVRPLSKSTPRPKARPGCSIPAEAISARAAAPERRQSRSRTRPGTNCAHWPMTTSSRPARS